jgi:hypothetical protein
MRRPWVRLPRAVLRASSPVSKDSSADSQVRNKPARDKPAEVRKSQPARVAASRVRDNATQVRVRIKAARLTLKTLSRPAAALARGAAKNSLQYLAYQQKYGDVPLNAAAFFFRVVVLLL